MSDVPDPAPTPDDLRARSRERWERQAEIWERRRDWFQAAVAPVSHAMIEALNPQPGHVVLEAAAGLGDTGLLAAELVHPGGKVIISDGAEGMVEAAKRHAAERGIVNVEVTPMELEWLDMSAASVDGILVRFGYMLVPDPETALRDARRVLRPGGRIALAVWDRVEDNPWLGLGTGVLADRGLTERFSPENVEPGPFSLASADQVVELLGSTGFVLPEVARVDVAFRSPSAQDARRNFLEFSDRATTALKDVEPELRDEIHAEIESAFAAHPDPEGPEGAIALPGAVLVAAADA
ncbi:class I SAM-dependent methyltransferase [Patulibacter sp.]|uniref:class I SAM-dependent methyltransferase n=1 Tax=Patulibacter sp. TaxID=1912859 RepID=UPI0027272A45|nr:class I SAM-dependent methyltransferase [Patulibacter sp.]MDO9406837.1 class I SAM-dependent methyltransferase [Patulibacter sp.]